MCPVGPAAAPADRKAPRYGQPLQTRAVKSHFEITTKPRAKADRLPSFSASFGSRRRTRSLKRPVPPAVAGRSPPRATQSASACHSARRTVRPVDPRLRHRLCALQPLDATRLRTPKSLLKSEQPALGSSRLRLRTPGSAGHPSQSSSGRDTALSRPVEVCDYPDLLCERSCEVQSYFASRCRDSRGQRRTLLIHDGATCRCASTPEPPAVDGFEVSYVFDDGAERRVPLAQAWAVPLE